VHSSRPVQWLEDILTNLDRIAGFVAGMDLEKFRADPMVSYAVQHALLIISEAAHKLGDQAEELCPGIPWPEVRGLGNRLRHEYELIEPARIWYLIEKDLPVLRAAVADALRRAGDSE
jgi:uncharacterized protein with HEPN domain